VNVRVLVNKQHLDLNKHIKCYQVGLKGIVRGIWHLQFSNPQVHMVSDRIIVLNEGNGDRLCI
jgi:hypothetical protein